MLIFPQISTGALVQFPLRKRRNERTILNLTEDGHAIALSDTNAVQIGWDLSYAGLTDAETGTLAAFFVSCEGSLQPFTFADPTANLILFSEDLSQPTWQRSSLLTLATGIDDPFGNFRASRLTNGSGASLGLTQTIAVPGTLNCCFSVYLRCSQPGAFTLNRTDGSTVRSLPIQPSLSWQRFSLSSVFAASVSQTCDFTIVVPKGMTLDIFGPQVDTQPSAGTYVQNIGSSAVYPNCHLGSDELAVTATAPGESSVRITIVSKANQ